MEITEQQLAEARKIVARANGLKGGRLWWDSLTEEARSERIQKMVENRIKNNKERALVKKNSEQ